MCGDVCPKHCISFKEDIEGFFYPTVDESRCVDCGLCAKKCPVQAIVMKDGYPVWIENECEMCLGCLHRCPMFAIQYGNGKTNKHGQYRNPNTTI